MEDQNHRSSDIARLTNREREALRGWMERKSAKEIALDLGVSHHAIEKRLKTARLKLGVGSSLAAARRLAEAEGLSERYQQAAAQRAEVPAAAQARQRWRPQPRMMGVIAMLLAAAAILALSQQTAPEAASPPATASTAEERIAASTRRTFATLDRDGSGFLEPPESPIIKFAILNTNADKGQVANLVLNNNDPGGAKDKLTIETSGVRLTGSDSAEQFYRETDRDGDGKISYAEFHKWSAAQLASIFLDLAAHRKP
jgi:DNA-binding CsgD family transcriptional regulator